MSSIRYSHDPELVIAVPSEPMREDARVAWAGAQATRFGGAQALEPIEIEKLTIALAQEQSAVQSAGAVFVAFDPVTRMFVAVRLAVLERALGIAERRAFLRPSAVLPGRLRPSVANSFGAGCSSAFPIPAHGGTGEIRWLYVATDASLLVSASPIPLAALPSIGSIAEAVLRSVVVGEVAERVPAADFDPDALLAESLADQPRWQG